MMTLLFTIVSVAAAATGCPNLSGTYQSIQGDGIRHEITLRQSRCERIEFTHAIHHPVGGVETTSESWIMDGNCRPVTETPELCISREFREAALISRGQITLMGQQTPIRRFEQKLRFEKKSGSVLVSDAKFYDFLGGLEERHQMRYTRAQAAPFQKAPAQKGKAPVHLDASTVSRP